MTHSETEDGKMEKSNFASSADLFAELGMPREKAMAMQARLERLAGNSLKLVADQATKEQG